MDYTKTINNIRNSIALVACMKNNATSYSTGSGFIFMKKGILVTCNHVIKDADVVFIKFPSSEYISSKVVVSDVEHDISLLKFDGYDGKPLEESGVTKNEGMPVLFSGYPLSMHNLTTHQGMLSAIVKDATGTVNYLIDGTVNSGNSGCPLLDKDGRVIGVVNAKQREKNDLLAKVEDMKLGAVSLHGVDLVEIYQALMNNVQLGIGYAVPSEYIPKHVDIEKRAEK